MRILYLVLDYGISLRSPGGSTTHIKSTVEGLRGLGHHVDTAIMGDIQHDRVILEQKEKGYDGLSKEQITFKRKFFSDLRRIIVNFKYLVELYRIRKNLSNYDVIYERSTYGVFISLFVRNILRIDRHVIETDLVLTDLNSFKSSKWFNRFFEVFERVKYRYCDAVFVQSKYSLEYGKKKYPKIAFKLVNKGLAVKRMSPIFSERAAGAHCTIGFQGFFMPYQRLDLLLELASTMDRAKYKLTVAGNGYNYHKYITETSTLESIRFVGMLSHDDFKCWYDSLDIAIIPNCAEHMYPVKFLEYISNGKVVVFPRYHGFKEFFEVDADFEFCSFEALSVQSMYETICLVRSNWDRSLAILRKLQNHIVINNNVDVVAAAIIKGVERTERKFRM